MPPSTPSHSPSLVSWNDGPDGRGTYNIISLCASTLLICVWTAVHMDIPTRNTFMNTTAKRSGWLVVGVLAPEILVLLAFGQLLAARSLVHCARTNLPASTPKAAPWWRGCAPCALSFLNTAGCCLTQVYSGATSVLHVVASSGLSSSWRLRMSHIFAVKMKHKPQQKYSNFRAFVPPPSSSGIEDPEHSLGTPEPQRKYPWSLAHGFYAVMGGFVIDTASGEPFLPWADTRAVLTPTGLEYLMKHAPDMVPDISPEDIADRSKTSSLSKALLCFQVFFFCMSCAARLAQHLPLTLLEVTTLAHSLCALVALALWWYKPQDIGEATVICGEDAREICAMMLLVRSSKIGSVFGRAMRVPLFPAELDCMRPSQVDLPPTYSSSASEATVVFSRTCGFMCFIPKDVAEISALFVGDRAFRRAGYETAQAALRGGAAVSESSMRWYMRSPDMSLSTSEPEWLLYRHDGTRLTLAARAFRRYSVPEVASIGWRARPAMIEPRQDLEYSIMNGTAAQRALAPVIIAVVYGIPHLLGSSADFASLTERRLWRLSVIAVTLPPVILVAAVVAMASISHISSNSGRKADRLKSVLFTMLSNWVSMAFVAAYLSCCLFLVCESLRQIFALPPGAFLEPQWSRYFPHFS